MRCKVEASEQILRNYYLPAFQALITEGHAQSIMTAYPAINGVPCTSNKWLITDILRKEWGFNGFVVSDCAAVGNIYREHHYVASPEEAAAAAMKAGLDLECNGYCKECYVYRDYLGAALQKGLVTEQDINGAAFHVLRMRFKLGIFDDPSLVPYNRIDPSVVGSEKHRQLALETARQSIVLLRNTGILPLDLRKTKSIAVLGINAATTEFGGYSGKPLNEPVSPLEGILRKVEGKVKVHTLPWTGALSQHEIIPPEYFFHSENGKLQPGLKAEYFSGAAFKDVFSTVTEAQVLFDPANRPPDVNIPPSPMSVRWSGVLKPKVSGVYTIGIDKANLFRLTFDGKKCFDNNSGDREKYTLTLELVAGKAYDMVVEYANLGGNYSALLWKTPGMENLYAAEKKLAKASDVAIVVLGINKSIEEEGLDRDKITLPDDQESFIREIYKANPRTVLVLIAGSPLAIPWEQEHVPGIVNAWYPGEQGGTALADVLFGDCNPGGRLPLTYYASLDELPAFNDYEVTNGRTYMYFTGKAVYPFGYGLSYTTFEYGNLRIDKPLATVGETLSVTVDVKNTGTRDGDEVVQLYLKSPSSGEVRPVRQLKGFRRIRLGKGEMQTVRFDLDRNALSYWNKDNLFVVDSGVYEVQVGASSADIRQKESFSIK
jgi:beta-glucosidase